MYLNFPTLNLAVKCGKVNQRSLFEQTWYYSSTKCYISNFKAVVYWLQQRRFLNVLPWIGIAAMFIMWPGLFEQVLFLQPKEALFINLLKWPCGCWKDVWICHTTRFLGQGQSTSYGLLYLHSLGQLLLQIFRPIHVSLILSMKPWVLAFYIWPCRKI